MLRIKFSRLSDKLQNLREPSRFSDYMQYLIDSYIVIRTHIMYMYAHTHSQTYTHV